MSTLALLTVLGSLAAAKTTTDQEAPDPGSTYLDEPIVRIDVDLETGRPMIDLMVDGRGPFKFVVDSGASLSVIDRAIAAELGLEVVGEQVLRSPGASVEIEGDRVQANRLQIGGLRIDDPVLATMDLVGFSAGTIEGVLGRPHFSELVLTVDYPGSQLVVARGALDRSDPAVVAFDPEGDSIRFDIDVGGVPVPMVLDTGSPGGFTLPKAMESRLEFRSPVRPGPTIRLVGGSHPTWIGALAGGVRLGAIGYESPEVKLTTISDEFGNLGFEVLRELRVAIDQANGLVRFEKAPAETTLPETGGDRAPRRILRRGGPVALGGPSGEPRIGVAFEMTAAGFVKRNGGFVIRYVEPGGPGDRAGLEVGDVVVSVGGEATADLQGVPAVARLMQGPRPLAMELIRGEERLSISVE